MSKFKTIMDGKKDPKQHGYDLSKFEFKPRTIELLIVDASDRELETEQLLETPLQPAGRDRRSAVVSPVLDRHQQGLRYQHNQLQRLSIRMPQPTATIKPN